MEGTENIGSATTGPASFAEVSWSDDSSSSSPSSESTTAANTSADATVPPAETQTPEGSPQQGEPPKERWDAILANAREKAVAEWKDKYGWAEQVNHEQHAAMMQFYQGFSDPGGDPVAFLQQVVERLSAHPEHGAKLRSLAARQLAAARGQQAAPQPDTSLPNVEITDAQGNVVGTLSQILAAERQRWQTEVDEKYGPALTAAQKLEKAEREAAANAYATSAMERLSRLADFETHKAEIGRQLNALKLNVNDERALEYIVKGIYTDVVTPKREKELSSKSQSELLDNLQRKAAASTSVNPGSAAPSTPKVITSFSQLGREAWD